MDLSSKRKPITFQLIEEAEERIKGDILDTPLLQSNHLSILCDCALKIKLESMQHCKSYKYRGALNKLRQLPPNSTVCTVSHGNHAQGVARAARTCGFKSIIYMPIESTPSKIKAAERYGGTVIIEGHNFEKCKLALSNQCRIHPEWHYISGYNDSDVIAGNGTVGLEIFRQSPEAETVVIPIGGGGLCCGVATALKHLNPKIRLIGVQLTLYPAVYLQFKKHHNLPFVDYSKEVATPLADGLAITVPSDDNQRVINELLDDIVVVNEDEIAEAVALLADRGKIISEGAGAAPLAAIVKKKFSFRKDEKVVAIISGGNMELTMLGRCVERALFIEGSRICLKVLLPYGTHHLVKLMDILTQLNIEVIHFTSSPHVDTYANKERYNMTLDIPSNIVLEKLKECLNDYSWKFNIINPLNKEIQ